MEKNDDFENDDEKSEFDILLEEIDDKTKIKIKENKNGNAF